MTTKKLWGGRFKKGLDDDAILLSYSLESDKRLVAYDLKVNQAHAMALHTAGFLKDVEFQTLYDCLEQLKHDFESNCHSATLKLSIGAIRAVWITFFK